MKQSQGYVHIRHTEKGGATAGWYRDVEANQIVIVYARCSHNDLYNKSVGRELVEKRLGEYLSKSVEERKATEHSPVFYSLKIEEMQNQITRFMGDAFSKDAIQKMSDAVTVESVTNKEIIRVAEGYQDQDF